MISILFEAVGACEDWRKEEVPKLGQNQLLSCWACTEKVQDCRCIHLAERYQEIG